MVFYLLQIHQNCCTTLQYYYAPQFERSILWSDSQVDIKWPFIETIKIADKDAAGAAMNDAEVYE